MVHKALTGVFLLGVGTVVCLTGVGLPLGIFFIVAGVWLLASRNEK